MLSNVTGVAIEGITIRHYRGIGIFIQGGSGNRILNNRKGMNNASQFEIVLNNEISYNSDSGLLLDETSMGNLVMDNTLVCNIPENIVDNGTDNNLINNIDKPCEPCKAPSDFCNPCRGESDNRFDESCSKTFKTKSRTCHRHLKERDSST